MAAIYLFLPGQPVSGFCRPLVASHSEQYFLVNTARGACPASDGYVTLSAESGQKLQIEVLDVTPNASVSQISVVDQGLDHRLEYKESTDRFRKAKFSSSSHQVTLVLSDVRTNQIVTFKGEILLAPLILSLSY